MLPTNIIIYILSALLIFGGTFGFGYTEGIKREQLSCNDFKTKVEITQKEQEKKVADIMETQKNETAKADANYRANIAAIRKRYGVRNDTSSTNTVPSVPQTTESVDGCSPYASLVERCAETTEQLIELQQWISTQEDVYAH